MERVAWVRQAGSAASAFVLGLVGLVMGVAVNVASSLPRLPGPANWVRWHALWSILACEAVMAGLGGAAWWRKRGEISEGVWEGQVPGAPSWAVARAETDQAVRAVLGTGSSGTVGITTGVHGSGGFGKTTVAQLVCEDKRIRRRFGTRVYWVTVGWGQRSNAQIAATVATATVLITGDTTALPEPQAAGSHLGSLLAKAKVPVLLVLDDVWEHSQLAPFLVGPSNCTRLVTTRSPQVLPQDAVRVLVDRLEPAQARSVLIFGVPGLPEDLVVELVEACGRWALLLRLANRWIAELATTDGDPVRHARTLVARLRTDPTATARPGAVVDVEDLAARNSLVQASVRASLDLLPAGVGVRFAELGAFVEDEPIPIRVLELLWGVRAGMDEIAVRRACVDLERLALIGIDPSDGGAVLLHDVLHAYARQSLGPDGVRQVSGDLVAAAEATLPTAEVLDAGETGVRVAWWELDPARDGYLLDRAVGSLVAAGQAQQALALAGDLRFIASRIIQRSAAAALADLEELGRNGAEDARERAAELKGLAYLMDLSKHGPYSTLLAYLGPLPAWRAQVEALTQRPAGYGRLLSVWPVPDQPTVADATPVTAANFLATLGSNRMTVQAVAFSPDGAWIATGDTDGNVRICAPDTGTATRALTGHTGEVRAVAFSPDGTRLATGGVDGSVRVWGLATDTTTRILTGHADVVTAVAFSPDGTWLATGSYDGAVRVWDLATGTTMRTLTGHTHRVWAVAISPDGTWLATGDTNGVVRVWDAVTGTATRTLTGHSNNVTAVAFSPDGTWIATGAHDHRVLIWDRHGHCLASINLNGPVSSLAWGEILAVGGRGLYGFLFAPAEREPT